MLIIERRSKEKSKLEKVVKRLIPVVLMGTKIFLVPIIL